MLPVRLEPESRFCLVIRDAAHRPDSTRRLARFFGVAINFFADNALGGFIQIRVQSVAELHIFGPERPFEKGPGHTNDYGGIALAFVAEGLQPIPATEREEEASLPRIAHGELHLDGMFGATESGESLPDAFNGGCRGGALTGGGGTFEERRDLP